MSGIQALASSISSGGRARRTILVITDLMFMWAHEVCIAGIDGQGRCVRPVTVGGVKRQHLFRDGRLVVFPGSRVQFDLSPTETVPPHIEDQEFHPRSIVSRGASGETEWEEILRGTSFPSVESVFGGYLEGGRRVPPGAQTRSLGTIGDVLIFGVEVDDSYGRHQYRLDFADSSGKRYRRFPINDLAFRTALEKTIEALGDKREAERRSLRGLRSEDRIYLRIGLARPDLLGDHPEACWTQVTGIYTFPDYLRGKTFADFV